MAADNESEESQVERSQEEDDMDEAENAEEDDEEGEPGEEDDDENEDAMEEPEGVEDLPPHEGKTIVIHQLMLNPPQRRFLAPAIVKVSAKQQNLEIDSAASAGEAFSSSA